MREYPRPSTVKWVKERDGPKASAFDRVKSSLAGSLRPLRSLRSYDIRNTVVMSGVPRSGTTWIGEILATIPRSAVLTEPLHLGRIPEARRAGLMWRNVIPTGTDWPEAERYLRRCLEGKVLNRHTCVYNSLAQVWSADTWILKCCRANMFLPWLTEKFCFRTPILLIRHPCAVIASQLPRRTWDGLPVPRYPSVLDHYPEFGPILDTVETLEEKLAASWCMDYYVPLSAPRPHPWHVLTYEGLVRKGESELDRMFEALGLETPAAAVSRLGIPSATTATDSNVATGKDRLTGWKERLEPDQIRRILRLVSRFGLDFYSEETEPDYERLASASPTLAC